MDEPFRDKHERARNPIFGMIRKGIVTVRLPNGALRKVEVHWYEAHGIGRKDIKIKRYLEET
jgi:hypothetical protein